MRTYGQYCPIARAAEVLGDRWTVLIIREMSFGVGRFNELQRCLPGISRSVLAQRLRHLQRVRLIEQHAGEYQLTEAGADLKPVLRALGHWAAQWAFGEPDPHELDTDLLMRWISRHMVVDSLPARRVVVRFDFLAPRGRRYWLVLQREEVSVCLHDPGFDTDVVLVSDAETLYAVYLGRTTLREALRDQLVDVTGPSSLVRALPRWFAWSDFAPTVRAAMLA
jgi:DNA-binding HxlR family transcriptional regulator